MSIIRRTATILATALAAAPAASARADVTDLLVSFTVANRNGSQVQCQSDGMTYTVKGHLTGPRSALTGSGPHSVSVFLHDLGDGEWFFRFRAVPGYDFATELARTGHVVLTLSDLGYLPSGQPEGMQSCAGSHADVLHQIIQQLRTGDYTIATRNPPRFSRIALAGFSYGALEAQIEAYSYRDIDALGVLGYADQGTSQRAISLGVQNAAHCALGGDLAQGDSGPGHYFYFDATQDNYEQGLFNIDDADPAVVAAAGPLRARAPCGDLMSIPQGIAGDTLHLGEITVPVLLVFGNADKIYPAAGEPGQKAQFSGSSDITEAFLENTGHAFTLERTAPTFRRIVGTWLDRHGFGYGSLAIARQSVRATHGGVVAIRVRCSTPDGSPCTGTLTLQTGRRTRLGARDFTIPNGLTQRVRVRLSRRALRLLEHRRTLRASATATPSGAGIAPATAHITLTAPPG